MFSDIENLTSQLKDVCRLSEARFAVWFERLGLRWDLGIAQGLTKTRKTILSDFVHQPANAAWMSGSLTTGRTRSQKLDEQLSSVLGCQRIYIFPNPENQQVLFLGADELTSEAQGFIRILTNSHTPIHRSNLSIEDVLAGILSDVEIGVSYELSNILERVLAILVRYLPCDTACVGLRYGDNLRLEAAWGYPTASMGNMVAIEENAFLNQVVNSRTSVVIDASAQQGPCPLLPDFNHGRGSWLAVPLIVGRRVIGIICTLSALPSQFDIDSVRRAEIVSAYMAPSIETSAALAEAAQHLEKFALLNEIASTASIGTDTSQVASRIVDRLRRIFNTDLVTVLLLTPDGQSLREFGLGIYPNSPVIIPVDRSLSGQVVKSGLPARLGDVSTVSQNFELTPEARSELIVPLKYASKVIGVLGLESPEPNAFSRRDEELLVVMASYLAGLIENVRLHEETRNRARNLELIHKVVERVVGLPNVAEIAQTTAELTAEQFAFELVEVCLLDQDGKELVVEGVGGIQAEVLLSGYRQSIHEGLMGRVFQTGKSQLINDTSQEPQYVNHPKWHAGSELCTPLREGDQVFGVLNVERSQKGAFAENDLLALEALSGVVSSVMMSARRYQQLHLNLRRLQAVRETALDIGGDLDLDTLLQRVTHRARELMNAKGAELGLVNEARQVVEVQVSENPWEEYSKGLAIPFSQGVAGQMAVEGQALLVNEYNTWAHRMFPNRKAPFTAVAGVPLKFKGQVIGTLTISNDETGRKFDFEDVQLLELLAPQVAVAVRNARLYQELSALMEAERIAKDRLIRSARLAAVGEMAAGVAHELNNPLTTVAGFVELILEDLEADSPHRPDLDLVLRESRRAREVVRRLLDFSRPGEGFRVRTDVNELINEVLPLVQHLARTGGVEIKSNLWEDIPLTQVDRDQIKQVLLNLIHNALQAMPVGGELQIVTAPKSRDDQVWAIIEVHDTGQGITPENLERLFEPFFTTRSPGKGTGLGLSVSYGIITDHGGFIDVESQVGEGSCFTVWLPVQNVPALR